MQGVPCPSRRSIWTFVAVSQLTCNTAVQGFQVEEPNAGEQKAVLPAQCSQLQAIRTLRLDCFSDMKVLPPQVLPVTCWAACSDVQA